MRDDFAVFILTHGRPDNVITMRVLELAGYTGKIYIVIDDEDPTGDQYRERYGDQVLAFSKDEVGETFDRYDNSHERRSIVWARNACWDLARQVGVRYFVQLDDDYTAFSYRRCGARDGVVGYHGWKVCSIDAILDAMVEFVATTGVATICMSQGGDHMGGWKSTNQLGQRPRLLRKAMNSFVCDVERPFTFVGRINEDVNTYVTLGALGKLFLTYPVLQLDQLQSQSNAGGMTSVYLDGGTYVKSMFTVIAAPSCVTVRTMGRASRRLHHHVSWRHAVPKIVAERHRR